MSDPGGDPGTPRTAPPPAAPRPPAPPPPPPPPAADALAADPVPPRRWRRPATVARSAAPRRGTVALPSVVAGLGLALSLPPFGFWPLAFPSAGLLWWRLGGLGPARRLWAGWLAGMGCFVPGLWWAHAFSLVGAVALMAIEALTWGLACVVVPRWGAGARLCAFPAAMTLAEAFRQAWPFGGLPIGGVFLGQAAGPVVGVARLGGPLLLTWVVFAAGAGLAALVESGVRAWWEARATAAAIAEGAPPGWRCAARGRPPPSGCW